MSELKNKVIWITGASSGIGQSTAYSMSKMGAQLILTALPGEALDNTCQQSLALGATAVHPLPYNLLELDGLEELAEAAWNHFGHIDILYNNAGISQRSYTAETDMTVFRRVMDLDFYAPVILTKAILPKMLKRGSGQFAVTSSIAGKFGFPMRSAYCSAKHALYGFFETVHAEYYEQNIRVTLVCPGRVQTEISMHALEKDGKPHGKMDDGQAGGITAEKAGKQIAHAIITQKREVFIGGKELLMVHIKRFFPGLAAKIARKIKST